MVECNVSILLWGKCDPKKCGAGFCVVNEDDEDGETVAVRIKVDSGEASGVVEDHGSSGGEYDVRHVCSSSGLRVLIHGFCLKNSSINLGA